MLRAGQGVIGAGAREVPREMEAVGLADVYVVRHGEADSNARGYLTSAIPGPPLTARGRRQARAAAAILADGLEGPPRIVTSPARRARETALPALERFRVRATLDPDLRELDVGAWEGRRARHLLDTEPAFARWRADPEREHPPGGELGSAVGVRVRAALERASADAGDGVVVAFSHQHALASLITLVRDLAWSDIAALKAQLPNAVIARFRIDPEGSGWRLLGLDARAYTAGDLDAEAALSTAP